jgi:hypothetical protein
MSQDEIIVVSLASLVAVPLVIVWMLRLVRWKRGMRNTGFGITWYFRLKCLCLGGVVALFSAAFIFMEFDIGMVGPSRFDAFPKILGGIFGLAAIGIVLFVLFAAVGDDDERSF